MGSTFVSAISGAWSITASPPIGGAVDALVAMRRQGGTVVLVTNAPRPHVEILAQLSGLGVPEAAFDAVVTSGDVCRSLIAARAGQPLYMIGPDRDLPLIAGLEAPRVSADEAAYVLCTGLFNDEVETAETYADMLTGFARRKLSLICANPDLVVDRGGRIVPCAGSLALAYEEMGGEAIYAGKPHRPIYDAALRIALREARRATIAKSTDLRDRRRDPDRHCRRARLWRHQHHGAGRHPCPGSDGRVLGGAAWLDRRADASAGLCLRASRLVRLRRRRPIRSCSSASAR